MWKRKWYKVILPWLSLLLAFSLVACSQPSGTTQESSQDGQPASQKPAEFEVGPITLEPSTVMVNDSVTATVTVKNIGDVAGTYTATFTIDGQAIDKKDITIEPGNDKEVSFQFSKTSPGSYNLVVGSASANTTVYEWKPYAIQYNDSDGATVGIYVSGENGHIVRFTPPAKLFRIQKIKIFGIVRIKNTRELDENHVTVRIWDKEANNQLWSQDVPWRLFMGDDWHEVKVPDIRVNDDFQIEVVTHSDPKGGDPIDSEPILRIGPPDFIRDEALWNPPIVVLIGFDYPKSYTAPSLNRPETRSGYSYMGKPIDPGKGRLKGINWLIRVEGEGASSN